jgi:Mg2+-importing ATPase
VKVAATLCGLILIANLILRHPLLDAVLFALAIAVGITPQLLPAVVSTSLARGTKRLAKQKVLVKSLIAIEDLGDMDVLITDKTGTLTTGKLEFKQAITVAKSLTDDDVIRLGMLASSADYATAAASPDTLSELDQALWQSSMQAVATQRDQVIGAGVTSAGFQKLSSLEFDHDRRRVSSVVAVGGKSMLVTKGAPEDTMALCVKYSASAQETLDALYSAGARVVAVASRDLDTAEAKRLAAKINAADEINLNLVGFLVFTDPAKPEAKASVQHLIDLGVDVKIATGDSGKVAEVICAELSLKSLGTLTGAEMNNMDDRQLAEAIRKTTIFARVSPEQKSRIIELLHKSGLSVGFLGDGVNDALALHAADVGISVNTATDVAKDAANVVLLDKDLGVLADGVREGRLIFANTMKYVLMGTSSNFGNMFSAATASAFLTFLPMLPSQILLNNLLYDLGQLTIPSDRVDEEQLRKPSHWDIGFIRRFMITFGPISSIFDFATFALMLFVFHAKPSEFQAGCSSSR